MSGALTLMLGGETSGGGSGGTVGAATWSNIVDTDMGSTNAATLAISGGMAALTATVAASAGSISLSSNHNGTFAAYTGAISCRNGDTLSWSVQNVGAVTAKGTISVYSGATLIGSFTYKVFHSS